ncbi:MAG: outer membrane lipoprotein carrier protein LolA [Opitutaceae bacterium]
MKNFFLRFALWAVLVGTVGPRASAEVMLPTGPDTLLADPAHDPAWRDLFTRLGESKTRQSKFEEHRYFPFRKTPVVLKGEIRIVPDRGMSLRYLEPDEHILIVDSKGLLMRDNEGREREAPADSRAQAITSAMVSVLRFDLAALEQAFIVHGQRVGGRWTLAFVPKDKALGDLIGVLAVSGHDAGVERIDLVKSPTQRIEILISDTRENVIFSGDAIRRFFR